MNKTVTLCFIDFQILGLNQLSFNVQITLTLRLRVSIDFYQLTDKVDIV